MKTKQDKLISPWITEYIERRADIIREYHEAQARFEFSVILMFGCVVAFMVSSATFILMLMLRLITC